MSAASPVQSPPLRFWPWLALVTVAAWALREYFVLAAQIEAPIRGDIRQYVAYALNLLQHGTFSQVWPGEGPPVPDAFRSPGYPMLLALAMFLVKGGAGWYTVAVQLQVLLGSLSVALTALLARPWLSPRWALAAGALFAIWPHHVVASGVLLSEVLFGFALLLALLLAAEAARRRHVGWAIAAGTAMSFATLVNPIALLLPPVAALIAWRGGLHRIAGAMLVLGMLGPAAWQLRNATIDAPPSGPGRGAINLVQGSWPLYHEAHFQLRRYGNPIARSMFEEMEAETELLGADPAAGLARIGARMSAQPGAYLRWYLLQKPFLLWDWDIRIGIGDIYFHRVRSSPFEGNALLHAGKEGMKALNPFLSLLALIGALLVLRDHHRDPHAPSSIAAMFVATCTLYLTAVHMGFQAEPRYATAYRGLEALLVVTTLARIHGAWRGRQPSPSTESEATT